ncbi:MAG: hypothetical protein J5I59_11975 [Saprospiraceae bacterium]|nr:hypothetical protein [Saprospiraceae bacterium]
MRSTKFYQIVKELTISELNRFERFLVSPYFNINKLNIDIFKICMELYKDYKFDISKVDVWSVVKPNEPYDDVRFRKYLSDLLKLLMEFFATEELRGRPILNSQLLLEYTNKKKIPKLINTSIMISQNASNKFYNRSSDYYLYHFQIEKNLFYLQEGNIELYSKKNVENIAENLDKFYIAEKLKYYCEILGREALSNIQYNFNFIGELLSFVEANDFSNDLIIRIYYLIYKTLSSPDNQDSYFELKRILLENYRAFDGLELQELFGAILNYCIAQINDGNFDFQEEMISIYDFIFEKNILLNENYLTPTKFKNVITTSLRAGNYDFAESFIKEYQDLLPINQKESIVTFSLAQIYFYKKEFEHVIEQLQRVEYPDLFTNLRAKTIYLATLLELREYDAINSWSESFKVFLNRKKKEIPAARIKTYQNFISMVRLISGIEYGDKKYTNKVIKELEKVTGNVVNEQWLKDKLNERSKLI